MNAKVIWLTGLSGSGKSTILNFIYKKIKKKNKIKVIDGDIFRLKKKNVNTFTRNNIIKNNINIIKFIKANITKYHYILVSVISPIKKTRAYAKKCFGKNYFEVFVHCKLSTLKKRDTKGLYLKADKKIINNLIGYKSKINYEKSNYKIISINTDKLSVINSVKKILQKIYN